MRLIIEAFTGRTILDSTKIVVFYNDTLSTSLFMKQTIGRYHHEYNSEITELVENTNEKGMKYRTDADNLFDVVLKKIATFNNT